MDEKNFSLSKYFKGKKPIEACIVAQISFLIWGARRIAEIGSEIAETAIHRVLCKDTKICKCPKQSILKSNNPVYIILKRLSGTITKILEKSNFNIVTNLS